jgi:hypothetical protein
MDWGSSNNGWVSMQTSSLQASARTSLTKHAGHAVSGISNQSDPELWNDILTHSYLSIFQQFLLVGL